MGKRKAKKEPGLSPAQAEAKLMCGEASGHLKAGNYQKALYGYNMSAQCGAGCKDCSPHGGMHGTPYCRDSGRGKRSPEPNPEPRYGLTPSNGCREGCKDCSPHGGMGGTPYCRD